MTPAARIAAAIDVLDAVLGGEAAEKALLGWSRRSRFAGSKDRAAVRDIVFQSLRCRRSYTAMGGMGGRGLVRGYMTEAEIAEDEIFGATPHAPPIADDAPLVVWDDLSPADQADVQDWVFDALSAQYAADTPAICRALRTQAPVWLRVNTLKADPSQVTAALEEAGHRASAAPDVPTAIEVARPARGLINTEAALNGWFEFQDVASQRAVARLGDLAGQEVLDFCAGGGGKSLALAAQGAKVTAHDKDPKRMSDLPPRAKRAGTEIRMPDATALRAEAFDLVVCDVPCSGSGAWRRSVETKWSLRPNDLDDLVALQRRIVADAARYVRPGGRLAYMTCSLFHRENANQVDLIAKNTDFVPKFQRQMTPLDGGDGFFVAVFDRFGD